MLSSGEVRFNFATSQPVDPELWEDGAYPRRRLVGGWEIGGDRIRNALVDYYRRTVSLSDGLENAFSNLPFWFFTNETNYQRPLGAIKDIGGAYVGVGTHVNYSYAAIQGASHAFIVDRNPSVTLGGIPLFGVMMAMAPTRAHFISLVLGIPLDEDFPLMDMIGLNEIDIARFIMERSQRNEHFSKTFQNFVMFLLEDSLEGVLGGDVGDALEEYLGKYFRRFTDGYNQTLLSTLAAVDEFGNGAMLSSEEAYARDRELFLQGRISGVTMLMEAGGFRAVAEVLRREGEQLGLAYLSNAEEYVQAQSTTIPNLRYYAFYRDLHEIPHRGDAMIVSAIKTSNTIFENFDEYVGRSFTLMPYSDESSLARALINALAIWDLKKGIAGGLDASMLDPWRDVAHEAMKSMHYGLASSANEVLGGGQTTMAWTEFDSKMRRVDRIYVRIDPGLKELILLNLVRAGVLYDDRAHLEAFGAAYPQQVDGEWRLSIDVFDGMLSRYYDRTLSMSDGPISPEYFDDERVKLFLGTNEKGCLKPLAAVENLGNVYVGVSTHMNFTYAARQNAEHAYIIDENAAIPVAFTPLYGTLLAMSPSRAHFISLVFGMPLPADYRQGMFDGMTAKEIYDVLRADSGYVADFNEAVIKVLSEKLSKFAPQELSEVVSYYVRNIMNNFTGRSGYKKPDFYLKALSNVDSKGRGATLSSEESFLKERKLFVEGRVTGIAAPFEGGGFERVHEVLSERGQVVGAVYLSNVEDWVLSERKGETPGEVFEFYSQLASLPRADDAIVISGLNLFHSHADTIGNYLADAIPLDLVGNAVGEQRDTLIEEAVAITARIKLLRKKMAITKGGSGDGWWVQQLRKEQDTEIGHWMHYYDELWFARKIIMNDGVTGVAEFEMHMMKECRKFARLHPAERKLFVNNLLHSGFLTEGVFEEDASTGAPRDYGMSLDEPASMGVVDSQVLYWFGNNGGNGARSGRPPLIKSWHAGPMQGAYVGGMVSGFAVPVGY